MRRLLWGLLILVSLVVSGCGAGGELPQPPGTEPLKVLDTYPIDNATGVTVNETFSFIFNNEINVETAKLSSFIVTCGPGSGSQAPLDGFAVSSAGTTVVINPPATGWPAEQMCTVSARGGYVKDVNDSPLAATVSRSFSTSAASVGEVVGTLSLLASPAALIADGSSTSTLTATLSNIDGVSGPAANKKVTFTASLGTITTADADAAAGTQVVTNSAGQATITYRAGTAAGSGMVTASYGALNDTEILTLSPAPPAKLDVAFNKAELNPGALGLVSTKSTKIYALVKDAQNNSISGHPVSFSLTTNSSNASLSEPTVTDASGWAEVDYTAGIVNASVNDTVTVSVGGLAAKTLTINVTPQTVGQVTINPATTTLVANGNSTTFMTVTVLDTEGDPIANKAVTLSVSSLLGGAILTPDADLATAGIQVLTNTSGVATINYRAGTISGLDYLTAKSGTISAVIEIQLTGGSISVAAISLSYNDKLTVAPPIISGGQSVKIYAQAFTDAAKTTAAANVDLAVGFPLVDDNKSGASLTPLSSKTDAQGYAVFTYTAGNVTSPVNDRVAVSGGGFEASATISVVAKVANIILTYGNLTTTTLPTLVAGQTLTIYAKVMDGNSPAKPVAGISVDFGFPINGDNKSGASFSPTSATTDANGVAVSTFTAGPAAAAVTDKITATAGGFSKSGALPIKPAVDKINLFRNDLSTAVPVAPATILTGSGASTIVYAQVLDGIGDPVAGVTVTFAFNVGKNLSGATVTPATFVTDAKGFAAATYKAGTTSGVNDELTVSVGTVTSTTAFKVDPAVTTIEFDRTAIIVDASSTDTLKFTLKNQLGQPMSNTAFTVSVGSLNLIPSVGAGTTGADGSYTFTGIDNAAAENTTITINAGGLSRSIPVYAGATLELTPASASAPADGVTNLTYTANVRDYAGVVLANIPVTFSGLNKVVLSTGQAITNASGNATVNVRSSIFTPTDGIKEVNAQAGALTAAADAIFEPGPANTITLTVPAGANPLSLGGETTITAVVNDALGNPVKDGTVVTFALDGSIGSVTGQAVTGGGTGTVTAPFQAGMKSGNVIVTATSGAASKTISLTIKPSDAGIIELSAVEPTTKMINIRGSGLTQSATIFFIVKDGAGNPVEDGTHVNFTLPLATAATVLAGGEAIATTTLFSAAVTGTTVNGIASVTLRSGMLARTVAVVATVNVVGGGTISTEARVTIVGGKPDSKHLSIATEKFNIPGGITFGLQNKITVFLGDRFSNIPLDGTPVSLYSECGTIGDSTGFTLSSVAGQVVATMTTQNPTTPNLAGVGGTGNVGMCTILAAMPGEEYFDDANADGIYDPADGDVCSGDQGEPYIDGNDNNQYDLGEFFVDTNNTDAWNGPDGNCSSSTMIWTDISVMMSSYPTSLDITPSYFTIPIGGVQDFNVNLSDLFGNALVAGTTLKITSDGGTLGGLIDFTLPDYAGYGNWYSEDSNGDGILDIGRDINGDGVKDPGVPIRFWLSADLEADAEPKAVKITVTRTGAGGATSETRTISGTINTPASWSRMSVSTSSYSLAAGLGTSTIIATLTDALGDAVSGATVNFSTSPSGVAQYGTFAPLSGVTNASGQVTTTYTAGQKAGGVSLIASAVGGQYVGGVNIAIIPAAVNSVNLSLAPTTVTTGGVVTASATVLDAYNNPVADEVVTFTLPTNNSGGSFAAPASATTNNFGVATINYTAGSDLSAATEIDTLRASVGAIGGNAALNVTTPAAAAKTVTMNLATSTMIANGTSTTTATAYVSDSATAAGKPVQGVEVLFTTTLGTIVGSDFTDASGMATAILTAAAVPGNGTVKASVGVLSATADFTLIPGPASSLINVLASPAMVKPSGTSTISVRVIDATGNAVADGTFVSFAVTTNNSGGYLLSTSATTVSGNASVVYKAGNSLAVVDDTITITSGAATGTVDVTVDTGESDIDVMTISAAPLTLSNSGTDTSLITATVTKNGLPVEGIDVSFANAGVAGSLFTTGGPAYSTAIFTDSNGQAKVVFNSGVVQGTATVTATFGAFSQTAVLTIVDKVANIVVSSDDAMIVANGTSTTAVTATVTDIDGIPLSGIPVVFNTTRGDIDQATAGTQSTISINTNASGQATATLRSTTLVGTALVTANYGTITDTEPVQFVVGPPATVTMTGSPTTLPYGAQTSLTVEVRDAQTRPVPNANLYFGFDTVLPATGNVSGGSYSLSTGTTDPQGRLTLNFTTGSTSGSDTLLVETEETGVDATLTIVVNPAAAEVGNMTLAAPTLSDIVANGATTTQLTATVTDSLGAPMNGVPVNFATTYGTLSAAAVNTNALGNATVTLTSTTTIGTAYVTAVVGGFQGQQTVNFIPGNPVAVNSSLTPVNGSLPADGSSTTEVNAVLKDANNNLVADGTAVTLNTTLGSIVVNPVTTINGVATFTVKAPVPSSSGTATLWIDSVPTLTSTIEFGVNNGANIGAITLNSVASNITVAGAGQPASTTITIQAVESDGTPIDESFWGANNTVRLTLISHPGGGEFIAGTGGVCSDPALLTEADCVVSDTWNAGQYVTTSTNFIDVRTTAGTATVTLQAGTLPGVIEIKATALDETGATTAVTASLPNITVAAGPPHSIVLIPGTSAVTANASLYSRPGTIIATDRFGNAVPDGTELNLGLVDTILAADAGAASTNGSNLTGTFIDTPARAIQAGDRVVITNADPVDRNRFIATGTTSPFTVTQNYNNAVVGGLNAYIGTALQGGFVSGADDTGATTTIGRTTTTNGIAYLNVTYPSALTLVPAGGYGCGGIAGSEGVFVVVTSNVSGVTTINEGGFCFAP